MDVVFAEKGLKRILEGELIPVTTRAGTINHYRVKGFHLEDPQVSMAGVIESTRTRPDARGIYAAKIRVQGVRSAKHHNFFPREWTHDQAARAITEAYRNRKPRQWDDSGRFAEGWSTDEIPIVMELDDGDQVIDAFPRRKSTRTEKRNCPECGSQKIFICPNLHRPPFPVQLWPIWYKTWRQVRRQARRLVLPFLRRIGFPIPKRDPK